VSGIQQVLLGGAPSGGYQIERSLRFNSADSTYLNRTPASDGNRKTWTWSGWVKRSTLGNQVLLDAGTAPNTFFRFDTNEKLAFADYTSGPTYNIELITTQVFRDFGAWGHITLVVDTTQATSSNRVKLYWNGSQITAFTVSTYPSQNFDTGWNAATAHRIGSYLSSTNFFNGYLTEINFIDGQALTPSSFGQTNASTGVWEPIKYTGTYGTNGFYLKFADNSNTTSTTLGKDSSGNGNNWTPSGFSVAAGVGNDSLVDTPTSYGTDTGAGGEVRGNYATWNPLSRTACTITNGNLQAVGVGVNYDNLPATIAFDAGSSDGFYWEFTSITNDSDTILGICAITNSELNKENATSNFANSADGYGYRGDGQKTNSGSNSSYGNSWTNNDVIGVAVKSGKIWFRKNGAWQASGDPAAGTNQAFSGISGLVYPVAGINGTQGFYVNFGQRAFRDTAPSGFKALCTQNLPPVTIGATSTTQANDYFNTVLYTGTGSSQSITGVGFQPDFVWIKERNGAADHGLYDAVRGVQKQMESNTITAESTETTGLTAFGTDGFTVGALAQLNTNTDTYVAWCWKANGAGSTNTAGTITSTVSANTTAGFSVLTYNPGNTSGTIGHGLGVAPQFIIVRSRTNSGGDPWGVYHVSLGNTKYLRLNTTNAEATLSTVWNDTSPTSTVVSIGTSDIVSSADTSFIMYCFAPVAGYSAFGSYTGNGNSDGPFIYTGMRPRFVMIKASSAGGAGYDWFIYDTARDTYNVCTKDLEANLSSAEDGYSADIDVTSNGFKLRNGNGGTNGSSVTYIYMAVAENPFKYSLAR
jgi:hypothetical protein